MDTKRLYRILRTALIALLLGAAGTTVLAKNRSDVWWNPVEAGRGLIVIDHETDLFLVWCTYVDGYATWYAIPGGSLSADRRFFEGDVYATRDSGVDIVVSQAVLVGRASVDFAPERLPQGWLQFSLRTGSGAGAVVETHALSRQPFGSGDAAWGADATDLWWNPEEPGWGVATIQHGSDHLFAVLLTYDYDGYPTFYVIPAQSETSLDEYGAFANTFDGPIYYTRTPRESAPFDPAAVRAYNGGYAYMRFSREAGRDVALEFTMASGYHTKLVRLPFGKAQPEATEGAQ